MQSCEVFHRLQSFKRDLSLRLKRVREEDRLDNTRNERRRTPACSFVTVPLCPPSPQTPDVRSAQHAAQAVWQASGFQGKLNVSVTRHPNKITKGQRRA
jgi:hypothetical protein